MQLTVFIGSSPRLVLRQLDIAIFGSQFHHCIEKHDGQIARHQFQQQLVAFLFHALPALQMQNADTALGSSCLHHQRQHLCA